MKAIEKAARLYRRLEPLFACPVCGEPMRVPDERGRSLICPHRHAFDLSAKGYVNFLGAQRTRSTSSGYRKEAFLARRAMLERGLFEPVIEAVADVIKREVGAGNRAGGCMLFDAGCGEGYVTSAVVSRLRSIEGIASNAVGMDISAFGVAIACQHDDSIAWCVGNIAKRLPVVSGRCDAVTNLLAPCNGEEFRRVMCDDGVLVKAAPLEDHFIELRAALYDRPRERPCTPDDATAEVAAWFGAVEAQRLTYGFDVGAECVPDVIRMSPLFWKARPERIAAAERSGLPRVTVDLAIIVAHPRRNRAGALRRRSS